MPSLRLVLPVVAALLAFGDAQARADDRATAQQLFQQGKELMRRGKLAEACPKFEAASEFSSTPGVRLNLAECWAKLGRTASAWAKFDEAAGIAERAGDLVAADAARKGRADLEPQLVYLKVVVGPAAAVPGLELKRDGETLPAAAWAVPIPVDPGKHEISAAAPGRVPWSTTETVEKARPTVTVVVPTLALAPVEAKSPVVEPPAAAPGPSTRRIVAWVTGGAGLAGLAVGAGFGIDAILEKGALHSHLSSTGQCLDATCQADSYAGYRAGNVSTIAFVAGGALLATGVVLFVIPSGANGPHAARVVPLVAPGTAALGVIGTW